jgi:hypothetical protein
MVGLNNERLLNWLYGRRYCFSVSLDENGVKKIPLYWTSHIISRKRLDRLIQSQDIKNVCQKQNLVLFFIKITKKSLLWNMMGKKIESS